MNRLLVCLVFLSLSLNSGLGLALEPRETALVKGAGAWELGVFNPLRIGVADGLELEAHPLFFFTAPHLKVRKAVGPGGEGDWNVSIDGGVWFPYPALRMAPPLGLEGYFIPTCDVMAAEPERDHGCQRPGWIVVPQVGVAASHGTSDVLTIRADLSVGVLLSGHRPRPLDTLAPLDLQLSPVFNRWRVHGAVRYDRAFGERLRGHVEAHIYGRGAPEGAVLSPLAGAVHGGLAVGLSKRTSLVVGLYYWNTDQGAVAFESPKTGGASLKRLRSHDFFPTFDVIWRGGDEVD